MKPFPWRPGMRTTRQDQPDIVAFVDTDGGIQRIWTYKYGWRPAADVEPDRNDAATLGALLGVVREVWDAPLAQVSPWLRWDQLRRVNVVDGWRVCLNDATVRPCPPNERAESEFAALLAAYQEAP